MKAAVYDASGPQRGVFRLVDLPRPEPEPGQVRVRLAFSGVNPTDIKAREGHSSAARSEGMVVPHHDGAGWIDGVGLGVPERRLASMFRRGSGRWRQIQGEARLKRQNVGVQGPHRGTGGLHLAGAG